ncbi:hypothetical protein GCM10009826_45150 [Humibacillus xanthopallidus]
MGRVSDEQPALHDGDLRLRPWTAADVEATRLLHDAEIAHWFDVDATPPTSEHHRSWVERTHAEWSDSRAKATFLVEWRGEPAGSVDVRRRSDGVGVLSWITYAPYRGRGLASRAVRLLVDWAFADLGLRRVEAEVNPLNRASLRTALRAGLRREGLLRGNTTLGGEVHDTVVLGRLAGDPAPGTREGFTAMLDSVLPTKRVIGQGLIRDAAGAVLLCEPVYKRDWDLPGGVVDPGEPPRECVAREIREELALEVTVGRLLATNWLAPWLGWGDAVLFVYEVETPTAAALARVRLLEREIRAMHWVAPHELGGRVAPYNERMLTSLAAAGEGHATLELADGLPVR